MAPSLTLPAQPNPTVLVLVSTTVAIPDFPQFYPSVPPDSFQPVYHALDDGSLLAPPLLDDLGINNLFLILTGSLLAIFLRNVVVSAIYLWRGKVKHKGLLYALFLSQLLGPPAIIPVIVAQFYKTADCAVILRIAITTCGVSLSLLLTGILGIKVYRCLDNNRLVLVALVVLSAVAAAILILDVIYLRGLRSLSGKPSAGLSSVFVMVLLTESFFICACFLYVVWKSHGPVAVRGRISLHLSLDDTHPARSRSRRETTLFFHSRNGWSGDETICDLSTSQQSQPQRPLSREPSVASIIHDGSQRMPASAKASRDTKGSIPLPSILHSRPSFSGKRQTSPVHSPISHFTRYVQRMSLFREVMRDELCYTALITAFTVVSVAMTLVGIKSPGGANTTIWITLDWVVISLLVMHSFGRVIQRHENESLLLNQSAWCHDLYTDCITAELLRDAPQPTHVPRILSKARPHRSIVRHGTNLSTCGLFGGLTPSSRGDVHSLVPSTSRTSNTFSQVETDSFTRIGEHEHISLEH